MLTAILLASAHLFPPSIARAEEPSATALAQPAVAEAPPLERLERLERRLDSLPPAPAQPGAGPAVTANPKDGFTVRSADGAFTLRPTGLIQADARIFHGDRKKPAVNTFLLRRVRPGVDVTFGKVWQARILPEFGGGTVSLLDAYVEWRPAAWAGVRAGKFKTFIGYEHAQSDAVLPFIERALPSNFLPNRDVGVEAYGRIFDGEIIWSAGVFTGAADGASVDGDTDDDKDGVGRVFFTPFRPLGSKWTDDLGIGVGGSYGHRSGSAAATGLPVFRTAGQQTWFSYAGAPAWIAGGTVTRFVPQLAWYAGPCGLVGEYARSTQELVVPTAGTARVRLDHAAWQATATVAVLGAGRNFKGKPAGAGPSLEVAGRFNELTVDPDAFAKVADASSSAPASASASARAARGWGADVNWYPAPGLRLSGSYDRTRFRGGAAAGADRENEQVWIIRSQISW